MGWYNPIDCSAEICVSVEENDGILRIGLQKYDDFGKNGYNIIGSGEAPAEYVR
jgi:hypothetical protein